MSAFSGDLALFRELWEKYKDLPVAKWALDKTEGLEDKSNLTVIMDQKTGWATLKIDGVGAIAKAEFSSSGEVMRDEPLQ